MLNLESGLKGVKEMNDISEKSSKHFDYRISNITDNFVEIKANNKQTEYKHIVIFFKPRETRNTVRK